MNLRFNFCTKIMQMFDDGSRTKRNIISGTFFEARLPKNESEKKKFCFLLERI